MRFGAVAAAGVAALVIGAVAYGYLSDGGARTPQARLVPPSGAAFGADAALAVGPNRGQFSPDGRQVAVLDRASVALATHGALKSFTPSGGRIVDFAWMPDSASVLVEEGPVPTGQVSVLRLDGTVKGTARLNPSIGFGSGHGMSVDSRGARAAVIAVDRDPIGGRERTDLAVIELATGAVTRFATADEDERTPFFVDDDTVAVFASAAGGRGSVVLVDLVAKARRVVPTREATALVGATTDGLLVIAEGASLVAVEEDGTHRQRLLGLAAGERAVASDPQARRMLVASDVERPAVAGGTDTVTQLRAVDVAPRSANGGSPPG